MPIFLHNTTISVKMIGNMPDFIAVFLILKDFIVSTGIIFISIVAHKPLFPHIAIWGPVPFLQPLHAYVLLLRISSGMIPALYMCKSRFATSMSVYQQGGLIAVQQPGIPFDQGELQTRAQAIKDGRLFLELDQRFHFRPDLLQIKGRTLACNNPIDIEPVLWPVGECRSITYLR